MLPVGEISPTRSEDTSRPKADSLTASTAARAIGLVFLRILPFLVIREKSNPFGRYAVPGPGAMVGSCVA